MSHPSLERKSVTAGVGGAVFTSHVRSGMVRSNERNLMMRTAQFLRQQDPSFASAICRSQAIFGKLTHHEASSIFGAEPH
jgi:hypothetical protein